MIEPINWQAVVDEAIRRRKAEGLGQRSLAALAGVSVPTVNAFEAGDVNLRFERVIAILEALDLFIHPGRRDSLEVFVHNARRRWEELVAPLPDGHPSRQPHGHSEQAYAILGLEDVPPLGELREILSGIPKTSGWTPFWVPTRPDIRPIIEDNTVECWLGRADTDRVFDDPAHSDFWRVSREPFAYLQRGYQEDGRDLEPGTIFDITLPIWRAAELFLHAVNFGRRVGANENTLIQFRTRYTGLQGRALISWARPLLIIGLDRLRARSEQVELELHAPLHALQSSLEGAIQSFLTPLYERFDGYELSDDLVYSQVAELRRQPGFGAERW